MPVAYARFVTVPIVCGSFGGDDARDAGEIVGDADVRPIRRVEKRLHCGQAVVTEFEYQRCRRAAGEPRIA